MIKYFVQTDPNNVGYVDTTENDNGTYTFSANVLDHRYAFDKWILNGYTRLDYIESSGTQAISTGVTIPYNLERVVLKCSPLSASQYPVWGHNYPTWGWTTNILFSSSGVFYWGGKSLGWSCVANQIYNFDFTYNEFKLDGQVIGTSSSTGYANYETTLFYGNGVKGSWRIYYCQLYNGDEMVRDFIPVIRHSDGAIGLLDLVHLKFYGNIGTGTFAGGNFVTDELPLNIEFSDNPLTLALEEDISLTAKYVKYASEIKAICVPNGFGTVSGDGYYPKGTTVSLTATPNDGVLFMGWSGSEEVPAKPEYLDTQSDDLITQANEIQVVFNSIVGEPPIGDIYEYGEPIGQLPTMEVEGFTFLGWYTDPVGGEYVTPNTPVTEPGTMNLYARWTLAWLQPIYWRTQEDVDNKNIIAYLNYFDLNRIEHNVAYLCELVGLTVITKTDWQVNELPTQADMTRIKNNIEKIREKLAFTSYEEYPSDPINHFEKVNTIEHLLLVMGSDIKVFLASVIYCGEDNYCGDILL